MKTKSHLFQRVYEAPYQTGSIGADRQGYVFGAEMKVISGYPQAAIVVEQTKDGGSTWSPVVTFELDRDGECATPANSPLLFAGGVVRARVLSITGGQCFLSLWMK